MSSEIEEIRQRKLAEMAGQINQKKDASVDWPEDPVRVEDSHFDEAVKKYPKLVVDCGAPWCGPCRMLSPIIDEMAKDLKGKLVFAKLNTDDNFGTTAKYRISGIPTLLFFKDGILVDKIIGAAPRPMIEAKIKDIFE